MRTPLRWLAHAPWPVLLLGLTLGFAAFGLGTLNLYLVLRANLRYLAENGLTGLQMGGALQLVLLAATGYASMAGYAIGKWFEHRLMDRVSSWAGLHAHVPAAANAPATRPRRSPPRQRRPSPLRPARAAARRARSAPR